LQTISTALAKLAGMLRINRCQRRQRAAGGNELEGRIGATRHARVLHFIHAAAMPETIVARRDTLRGGFLEGLVFRLFRRMHRLFARLSKGL